MATGRLTDLSFKTLTQNAKPVIDKDSNLTANTIIAEGDLYVLGNIYGGDAASITTQDEGVTLSSTATTLNFIGAGVVASGAGAVTTVTVNALPVTPVANGNSVLPSAVTGPDNGSSIVYYHIVCGNLSIITVTCDMSGAAAGAVTLTFPAGTLPSAPPGIDFDTYVACANYSGGVVRAHVYIYDNGAVDVEFQSLGSSQYRGTFTRAHPVL
jgi:hypothetical protein